MSLKLCLGEMSLSLIITPEGTHHLVLGVYAVIDDGKQPRGALQCVGAAGLQVQRAQAPVLQLTWQTGNQEKK